jgi:hypothetical protein
VGTPRRHGTRVRLRRADGRGLDYVAASASGSTSRTPRRLPQPAFTGDATFIEGEVVDTDRAPAQASRWSKVELRNQDDAIMATGEVDAELPVE